jgi:hypothetical protein
MICLLFAVKIVKNLYLKFDSNSRIEVMTVDQFQGRGSLLKDENADYHSYLFIIPDNVTQEMKMENYYFYESSALNNLYTIVVEYTLADNAYQEEKKRLSELKITYEGEEKSILRIEDAVPEMDCYLATYDNNGNYEYALTDDTNHRIVCVFTQYMGFEKVPEKYQIKFNLEKELWESKEVAYNMYWFQENNGNRTMPELDKY